MEVTESQYPWEREALGYLRERLPDSEPFRAWSNFEFVADDGSINEVDLLVVSLYKVYLVEIKSRPGRLTGDAGTWTWAHEGREIIDDNPLLLANRKAKKLKSLLQRQGALARQRLPYLEPVIFLSHPSLRCDLDPAARTGVCLREDSEKSACPDVITVLSGRLPPAPGDVRRIDRTVSKAIGRAMEQAGIRPSQRHRRVGDYVLQSLILETDLYQDWEAAHVNFPKSRRRVRIYPVALRSSAISRADRRRAAEREFQLLDGVVHPGILRIEQFTEHERGPALVFEHDAGGQRLDLFLLGRGREIDLATRLDLLRQIAETLHYAHSRRLYHRALSPQTVLVTSPDSATPGVKVFDWQTGRRDADTGGSRSLEDSLQPGLSGDAQSVVYRAPETVSTAALDPVRMDVFALGAVAYHLFSGEPPAASVEELHRKLESGRGLRISDVLDGVAGSVQDLIELATDPSVEDRPGSVGEFLQLLEGVEKELTAPPETTVHPLDARAGDRLPEGFEVKRRLGKGSSSVALLVERDGQEGVLKVALDPSRNAGLRKEAEALTVLHHQHVVQLYGQYEIAGHVALFMAKAGAETKSGAYTLAERLREEGRLSLDLLQRFGDELLSVLGWLEIHGISHRDIKPDNIGIAATRSESKALTLILFDFSLSDTPLDNIRAGTPPYLDPFLRLRKPPRWDTYAERFAAAMTLYEMATGQLPIWGDGQSDPSLLDCEVSLDAERFDPAVREGLAAFFAKALARNYQARYDNAEDMRRAWFRVFEHIDRPATDHGETGNVEQALAQATETTAIAALGLSARVLDALERIGAHTLGDLVRLPRIRLYRNKGIGQKTVKEIRDLAERVAEHLATRAERPRPEPVPLPEQPTPVDPRLWSVDLMAARLAGSQEPPRLFGLGDSPDLAFYASPQAVAEALAIDLAQVRQALDTARDRWSRQPWMTALRDDLARLVDKHAGVMTGDELGEAVLAARGSVADGPRRMRLAAAVAHAALETEAGREGARFLLHRDGPKVLVVATEALGGHYRAPATARARYARRLAGQCDRLALADPLPAPIRAIEALLAVPAPAGDRPIPPERLTRLAVRASERAALSSRMEIYPKGMPAVRALKLGAGSLLGPKALTVKQVQQRIASRYPDAEAVPGPPALDRLLQEAGVDLVWDVTEQSYSPKHRRPGELSTGSTLPRLGTGSQAEESSTPEVEDARALEARIERAVEQRRFLVLGVTPRHLLRAEQELVRRFPVRRMSLEALLIGEMKALAEQARADWDVVLRADAAERDSKDWRNLTTLVRRAAAAVERRLLDLKGPGLLVYPGLLARYGQLDLLERLRDACAQGTAPGFMVLIPADRQTDLPVIDGQALPVVLASQWARLTDAWVANEHRGTMGPKTWVSRKE